MFSIPTNNQNKELPVQISVKKEAGPKRGKAQLVFHNCLRQGQAPLLTLDVDYNSRKMRVTSFDIEIEDQLALMPLLCGTVARAVKEAVGLKQSDPFPVEGTADLFKDTAGLQVLIDSIYTWLKAGGNPNGTLCIGSSKISFLTFAIFTRDFALTQELLLKRNVNLEKEPVNHILFSSKMSSLHRCTFLQLMLQAGKDPFSKIDEEVASLFEYALIDLDYDALKVILLFIDVKEIDLASRFKKSGINPNDVFVGNLPLLFMINYFRNKMNNGELTKLRMILLIGGANPFTYCAHDQFKCSFFEYTIQHYQEEELGLIMDLYDFESSAVLNLFKSSKMDPNKLINDKSPLIIALLNKRLPKDKRLTLIKYLIRGGGDSLAQIEGRDYSFFEFVLRRDQTDELQLLLDVGISAAQKKMCAFSGNPVEIFEEFRFRKMIAHRYGIPITFELFPGVERDYEGFSGYSMLHNLSYAPSSEFKQSVTQFFNKRPELKSRALNKNLEKLFSSDQLLTSVKAILLAEEFAKGELIILKGNWPQHHVTIFLQGNTLWVCNRGAYRGKDTPPGIQLYFFDETTKITADTLIKLSEDPSLLTDLDKQKILGLKGERPFSYILKDQSGGFCGWQNRKISLIPLLVTQKYEGAFTNVSNAKDLAECFKQARQIFKEWSREDRRRGITQIIERYTKNPQIVPDKSLLLFLLAGLKSEEQLIQLGKFLKRYTFSSSEFLKQGVERQTLLYSCKTVANLKMLETLAQEKWSAIYTSLRASPETFLMLAAKDKLDLVQELMNHSPDLNCKVSGIKMTPMHALVKFNDVDLYKRAIALGGDISVRTADGASVLDLAMRIHSDQVVDFLITNYPDQFFPTVDEKTHYLKLALDERLWDGAQKLWKLGGEFKDEYLTKQLIVGLYSSHQSKRDAPGRLFYKLMRGFGIDVDALSLIKISIDLQKYVGLALLLKCGADPNQVIDPTTGERPLHLAAALGDHQMVQLFLTKGADLIHRNKEGKTPLEIAKESGADEALISLLSKEQGAV